MSLQLREPQAGSLTEQIRIQQHVTVAGRLADIDPKSEPEVLRVLWALDNAGCVPIVVGDVALVMHGVPVKPRSFEIVLDPDEISENLQSAARGLDYHVVTFVESGEPGDIHFEWTQANSDSYRITLEPADEANHFYRAVTVASTPHRIPDYSKRMADENVEFEDPAFRNGDAISDFSAADFQSVEIAPGVTVLLPSLEQLKAIDKESLRRFDALKQGDENVRDRADLQESWDWTSESPWATVYDAMETQYIQDRLELIQAVERVAGRVSLAE